MSEQIILQGDCLDVMRTLASCSISATVSDPPYGLSQEPDIAEVMRHWLAGDRYEHGGAGFMGKRWDSFVPGPEYWRECFRVMKPGAYLLAFAGSRTWDLMSMAIRFAGFENRDSLSHFGSALVWTYGGAGFPKSRNISKGIDSGFGAERKVVGIAHGAVDTGMGVTHISSRPGGRSGLFAVTESATPTAQAWDGWETGLRPCWDPILVFRKPFAEITCEMLRQATGLTHWCSRRTIKGKSLAQYMGLGYIPIMGPPPDDDEDDDPETQTNEIENEEIQLAVVPHFVLETRRSLHPAFNDQKVLIHANGYASFGERPFKSWSTRTVVANALVYGTGGLNVGGCRLAPDSEGNRRWPPNMLMSHLPGCGQFCMDGCPVGEVDRQSGIKMSRATGRNMALSNQDNVTNVITNVKSGVHFGDTGGASRSFAVFDPEQGDDPGFRYVPKPAPRERHVGCEQFAHAVEPGAILASRKKTQRATGNHHTTVKTVSLMSWLVRLVCPPGGVVLDPFAGSGSTGMACKSENLDFVGIERDPSYVDVARARIAAWGDQQHPK